MRLILLFLFLSVLPASVHAQTIIRDTEIEDTLRRWATPIFEAANLTPDNVNIILIQSPDVNAFVAGGSNIFLYTGLLEKAENPGEIIGVIAHETGHISGGHLVRLRGSIERASYETIIGTILGIGVAVLSGEGAAAGAIISGSQSIATSRFLSNSRLNESSADQAGLKFMNASAIDPKGLLTFLQKLEGDELLPAEQQSEYVRTHPLTSNRIEALETKVEQSAHLGKNFPSVWNAEFARMKAKLKGFITPEQVAWSYPASDLSVAAHYARAIAAYRTNNVESAISRINNLIDTEPKNAFFHELKGQMLTDFGRVDEAIIAYKEAVKLKPKSALIRIAYAHALIESATRHNQPDKLKHAITELEAARRSEKRSTRIYRLLATAHGRLGNETRARLNLSEEAILQRQFEEAKRFANYVIENSQEDANETLRAQDILQHISENE